MAATLKDVAQAVGVSIITVSKVMRGHTDIGEQTRERVLQKAKELNFRPNLAARSLVTGRSSLVGLVVPGLLQPYFAEVAKALAATLRREGYYLLISSSEEDPAIEAKEIEHLLALRLDALIVASCAPSMPQLFLDVQKQGTPLILLDRTFDDFHGNFIGSDNLEVGYIATKHLLNTGPKRLAHMRGPDHSIGRGRYEGFVRALSEAGAPLLPEHVVEVGSVDVQGALEGQHAMARLLALQPRPDGVFCYSDPVAIGVIDAILEAGLRVPEDIAVIGCGNLHYDGHLRVPLASIDQNSTRLGMRTAKILMTILASKSKALPPRHIVEPARLIVRTSAAGAIRA